MKQKVYNFSLTFDWKLLRMISHIDRFDASWSSIEKREETILKHLKSMATIQSVGSSTRIEGSKMSDKEVEILLKNIDISKLEDRDSQEVAGYSNVTHLILESFDEIEINESNIKNLHNQLLKFSSKDDWHRRNYKQHTNAVEATFVDGTRQIIFQTEEPGYPTEDAMRNLITWYHDEKEVHPLIIAACFAYDFLSIHPFQDGNGRLSRLITNLLLLKFGYNWIEYISFEQEVERNKKHYYQSLRNCQAQRPNEDVTDWVEFFLNSLISIQNKLQQRLEKVGVETALTPKEKEVLSFILTNSGAKIGEMSEKLDIPLTTLKRILKKLISFNLIKKYGKGAGTNYAVK